eukprot:scaffold294795_cov32-Prasinocladus_malaysianus.AAC.1
MSSIGIMDGGDKVDHIATDNRALNAVHNELREYKGAISMAACEKRLAKGFQNGDHYAVMGSIASIASFGFIKCQSGALGCYR